MWVFDVWYRWLNYARFSGEHGHGRGEGVSRWVERGGEQTVVE